MSRFERFIARRMRALRRLYHEATCSHPVCVNNLGAYDDVTDTHVWHRVQAVDLLAAGRLLT